MAMDRGGQEQERVSWVWASRGSRLTATSPTTWSRGVGSKVRLTLPTVRSSSSLADRERSRLASSRMMPEYSTRWGSDTVLGRYSRSA